jgi:predicted PurR-regulated permease PerM
MHTEAHNDRLSKLFLIILVVAISAIFFGMIRSFLMTILLSAIFAGMAHPLYLRIEGWFRGRRGLASATTLLILLVVVFVPFLLFLGIVAAQAVSVSGKITPWISEQISQPDRLVQYLEDLPFYDKIEPYREQILNKAGALLGGISEFLINSLSSATRGTVAFFFQLFVMLYAMFWFLMDGGAVLRKIMYYMPLKHEDEMRMLDRFTSVTRATLKGSLVIGIVQGGLAGLAFAVVGIDSALFWGTLMAVLSIIPGIGTGLVWLPAAVILIAGGHTAKGIGLVVWCALVVGSVDNVLRPWLVGKDTKMHDLLIFFGTLGGILLFGVPGFIIGPIVAALFVTVWDIYGVVFRESLPAVGSLETVTPPSIPDGDGDSEGDS